MRLAATDVGDGARMYRSICLARGVLGLAIVGPEITGRVSKGGIDDTAADAQVAIECMRVFGQLLDV